MRVCYPEVTVTRGVICCKPLFMIAFKLYTTFFRFPKVVAQNIK